MYISKTGLAVLFTLLLLMAASVCNAESDSVINQQDNGRTKQAQKNKNNSKITNSYTDPLTGMEFVRVPSGCFMMGSESGDSDEKPAHEICVDGFWIGKYEVTNAQYRKYNPYHDSRDYMGNSLNGENQPAVYISWTEAVEFALWMSAKGTGNYRLPTEAEWEYAARAGTNGRIYWGDSQTETCSNANVYDLSSRKVINFDRPPFPCDDGYVCTSPVGKFKANQFGLHDMMGNVWEWCSDWYDNEAYAERARKNPAYRSKGIKRVLRGGGWNTGPEGIRASNRGRNIPDHEIGSIGFRLVRTD